MSAEQIRAPRTKDLLKECLKKQWGERYSVKVPSGFGEIIVQRCRVELSKIKNKLIANSIQYPRFKLRSDIVSADGYDLVSLWRQREEVGDMDIGELGEMLRDTARQRPEEMPKETSAQNAPFKLRIGMKK